MCVPPLARYRRTMLRLVIVAVALVSTPASIGVAASSTVVRGIVVRSPTAPVCVEVRPCSAPLPGATIVFSRDGSDVVRVVTNSRGRFVVELAPGTYGVRIPGRGPLARLSPRSVRIRTQARAMLRFVLDTGIRAPGATPIP